MQNLKPAIALALFALGGCSGYSGYYQAGQTVSRLSADQTACDVTGVQQVPPNTQLRRTAPTLIPPREICRSDGKCRVIPARYEPGDTYTVDVNEGLRNRVVAQCMAGRGYERVQVPGCSAQVARAAKALAPRTLPPLNDAVCAARAADGTPVFVTVASSGG